MPIDVPSAVISVPISWLDSILSKRARSTLRILPRKRQDRLVFARTALLGRTACRVALDQEEFGLGRIAFGAIRQLSRQRGDIERALAAREFARLARSLAGRGRLDDLADEDLRVARMFFQPRAQAPR